MSLSFNDLKRSTGDSFTKLNQELNKLTSGASEKSSDDRLWKVSTDKAGNGYAVIRFLPAPGGEDVPFVRIWDHGFQGPGGWYIEKSLTTFNEPDPLGEMNQKLWNTGSKENQDIVRSRKRRLSYFSNIYVVNDPANPANNGKVFLFKYGKKIFDKINDLMSPQFEDEKPVNPFDLWAGANFKLKVRKIEGYPNYDKSEFDGPTPLADDDELERIWKSQYSLQELLDRKHFKTYADLKQRLDRALGNTSGETERKNYSNWEEDVTAEDIPFDSAPKATAPQFKAAAPKPAPSAVDDDDDDIAFFKKLAEDD